MSERRVVVTALGLRSAFPGGVKGFREGLMRGKTGLRKPGLVDGEAFGIPLAGEVSDSVRQWPGLEGDRKAGLLLEALEDMKGSGDLPPIDGCWLGTGLSSVIPEELEEDVIPFIHDQEIDRQAVYAEVEPDRLAPGRHLPERALNALADAVSCAGVRYTSFSACAAGAQAIAEAYRAIKRGEVERALCGGQDAMIHPLGVLSFSLLGALSPTQCRPFDKRRDGFSIGEGAALLLLEEEQVALERGARPIARLLGAGSSVDAFRPTAPHSEGRGAVLSMQRALRDAGLSPASIDHVNAHGTGTPVGDAAEASAIAEVFGPGQSISSIKGAVGHTIAAAGAVEAIACALGVQEGFVPGTSGCEDCEDWPVVVERVPRFCKPRYILSNSMGFGGQNCSLIWGRIEG